MNNKDKGWVNVDEEVNKTKPTEKNTFEVDGQKFDPYAMNRSQRVPNWLKACIMKWWLPGAVFYFISFGFEGLKASIAFATVLGLVWGLATDTIFNHFLREMSSYGHDYKKYIFCGRTKSTSIIRRYITLPINLVYGVIISQFTAVIISILLQDTVRPDDIMFFFGSLIYATIMFGFDITFSLLRNPIEKLFKKLKKKKSDD